MTAVHEIESNLGILSEVQQGYAHKILEEIKKGTLDIVERKTFMQYIQEYQERNIRSNIHTYAENFGINEDELLELYVATGGREIDSLRLEKLEKTADEERLKVYYNSSLFRARTKLHQDIKTFIEERKADVLEEV